MSNERDPWVLLGIDRDANDAQIKSAYRKLALRFHPDRNKGDDEAASRFQDIARAYNSISTSEGRTQWLAENEDNLTSLYEDAPFPDLDDEIAEDTADSHPGVVHETITIDFKQAFEGLQAEVNIEIEDMCQVCGGSGAAPGHRPRQCSLCKGTGRHRVGRISNKCSGCDGRGFRVEVACPSCNDGKIREKRPFIFRIPPGVANGHKMTIAGQQRGQVHAPDIILTIEVEPSMIFQRNLKDAADLRIDVPISYSEAILGASVKIPTPTKVIALKIPPGTSSGKQFRISGQGMPKLDNPESYGNLYAQTQIVVPSNPNQEQMRLIKELQSHDSDSLRYKLFNPTASAE